MAVRSDETAGEVYERKAPAVCAWCGTTTHTYANARLAITSKINTKVALQDYILCASCQPKIEKGLQNASQNRAEAREDRPTRPIERHGYADYRRWEEKDTEISD